MEILDLLLYNVFLKCLDAGHKRQSVAPVNDGHQPSEGSKQTEQSHETWVQVIPFNQKEQELTDTITLSGQSYLKYSHYDNYGYAYSST